MEAATYYRYYYSRGRTFTLECLLLFLVCLFFDILIFRAHWSMTYDDPGYLNDSPSIVAASELAPYELSDLIETTICRLTGLSMELQEDWPHVYLVRCYKCKVIKSSFVHHCSQCEKCVFMMDHHCCFSDRCIGYYSFKPFV